MKEMIIFTDDGNSTTLAVYTDLAGLPDVPQSTIYEVTLIQGSYKVKIPVFQSTCPIYEAGYMDMAPTDSSPLGLFKGRSISWVNFSFDKEVTVEVKVPDQNKVPVDAHLQ